MAIPIEQPIDPKQILQYEIGQPIKKHPDLNPTGSNINELLSLALAQVFNADVGQFLPDEMTTRKLYCYSDDKLKTLNEPRIVQFYERVEPNLKPYLTRPINVFAKKNLLLGTIRRLTVSDLLALNGIGRVTAMFIKQALSQEQPFKV